MDREKRKNGEKKGKIEKKGKEKKGKIGKRRKANIMESMTWLRRIGSK